MKSFLDFKIYGVTWAAIAAAFAIFPCTMFLPESYGYENGLLENLQMLTLFAGFLLAVFTKDKKNIKFFYFAGMVICILALREINCGRTLFFPIPGEVNAFYGWKNIKYGYLAHPLYGLYMAFVAFYFFKNKLFITVLELIKKYKLPVWNIVLMLFGMGLGLYAEHTLDNMVLEECSELLFYISLTGIIYIYSFNNKAEM